MKKKMIFIVAFTLLICNLTACEGTPGTAQRSSDSTLKTPAGNSSPNESKTPDPVVEFSEEDEQELYNLYVDINNYMVGRLYDSIERYFKYVAFEEEFSLIDNSYTCYSMYVSLLEKIEDAYTMASSKSKKTALDEAFLAMYPSLTTLFDTLNSIYEYSDLKSYMDDDYAKAKEYHAVLWTAYAEYAATGTAFMDELDIVAQERQVESLKIMQEEGYEVFYNINMMFICADTIQAELYYQEITDENLIEMDLEVIQPLYDEFVGYVETILSYQNDSEQLRYEGIPQNSGYWITFLSALKDTKVSLTGIIQRVKDQKPVDEFELKMHAFTGDDTIASFDAGVSKMISDYNNMIK